ncbi:50S ribosomal protein L11 methyltransferase [Aestuariirhabdus litorea]|uniref:Ribosomal protein L11 methyltransferase n=1 Tax=Aestuariirhabdus litorea TaxID=2528527 RepID=A0A3P3VN77_9GAMM|nr:50S ribosomal protein L11 methyltransferase [Aestuariirhabdus litorea]RRJ82293.1 50S ribosomal protein L11 methyltransferase [Aestuariirhabdus litorea]RWW92459.1 50S ribosomal protein L11 methyltransferase [Endozoicomonadaceae bacterium GTF-13]
MAWLQLRIDITPDQIERFEEFLLAFGAHAVTLEDRKNQPLFEPTPDYTPFWDHTRLTALFDADTDMEPLLEQLRSALGYDSLPRHQVEILEDKDWVREWMSHFEPTRFGQQLWVCPSWKPVPDPDAVNLMLDPGLAFGTGTHPTTALCLEWLDGQPLRGQQVVDYGCGSGILGIAALLLGAERVTGVDYDPQALEASADNLQRNQLPADAMALYLPGDTPELSADLVIANILAGPLQQLYPTLDGLLKPGGRIALSGILVEQAPSLLETYSASFDMEPPRVKGDWVLLYGRKRG